MLQKILEMVFIAKKFTQCKTSSTFKMDVVEIPDNKIIGNLFPKFELNFSYLELPCLPHHICQLLALPTETPLGQTRYPSKSSVFKRHFSFRIRQYGQQQLCHQ